MAGVKFSRIFLLCLIACAIIPVMGIMGESCSKATRSTVEDNADTYIYLDPLEADQEILPATTATYEIVVRNLGDSTVTYYPPTQDSLGLPTDWVIQILPTGSLVLAANNYGILIINLTAPENAKANTLIELEITGTTSATNAVVIPATITAKVHEIFEITLSTVPRIILDSPLDPQNFKITIINNGNVDDRIQLQIFSLPSGLELSQDSYEFIIESGMTEIITITMYPSTILTAGEYELNISLYRISSSGKSWLSSQQLWVEIRYYPDLYISSGDIEISKYTPYVNEDVMINITVQNIGDSDASDVNVIITPILRSGSILVDIDRIVIEHIGRNESKMINVPWCTDTPAVSKIQVTLDPENLIAELDEENNNAELPVVIRFNESVLPSGDVNSGKYTLAQVSGITVVAILSGITLAVAGFSAATENGKFTMFKLIAPLYTRVKKEEVLNHEVRELVYDYVQTHPGEHFRAILTKLGLTNGTLIHHLQTLERQEFIKSERDGPFKRFYPTGRQFTEDILEINGIQKKILDEVAAQPGITQKDLAIRLHTSPPTINYHIKALRGVRLINLQRDGKNTRCFPGTSINGWYKRSVS